MFVTVFFSLSRDNIEPVEGEIKILELRPAKLTASCLIIRVMAKQEVTRSAEFLERTALHSRPSPLKFPSLGATCRSGHCRSRRYYRVCLTFVIPLCSGTVERESSRCWRRLVLRIENAVKPVDPREHSQSHRNEITAVPHGTNRVVLMLKPPTALKRIPHPRLFGRVPVKASALF